MAGRSTGPVCKDLERAEEAKAVPVVVEELLVCKSEVGGGGDSGEEETRAVLRGLRDAALNT